MRVVLGLLLVLLGLCGSGAQGEGGGLSEVGELSEFPKTDPRDAVEESSEQTYTDIWAEMMALRDMVVELKVEVKNMERRLTDSESQVDELKAELMVTKVHVELLQRENSAQATELKSLETRLTATESKTSDLQKQNADLQARLSSSESELLVSKSRIDELERENTAQATELKSLETRLTATESKTSDLQKQNADLQARLSSSESELLVSKSRIDELERENAAQATELKSLETRLTATESKTSDLQKQNADLEARLSSSESELLVSKSRIDELERENTEKPKVAFYTALTNAGTVGPYNIDMTLKYSKVFTNIGNAYNPATGFFTAPVRGVYYFQFTVFGSLQNNVGVFVYKNNQRIMYNGEWGDDNSVEYLTDSVILELIAGDTIHLVLPPVFAVYDNGDNHSTFSGALLFTL